MLTEGRCSKLSPFPEGTSPSSVIAKRRGVRSTFREFVVANTDQFFWNMRLRINGHVDTVNAAFR
jgi:hypothetical protein